MIYYVPDMVYQNICSHQKQNKEASSLRLYVVILVFLATLRLYVVIRIISVISYLVVCYY